MKTYRFDRHVAWPVSDYGSSFLLSRLLWVTGGEVRVDLAYLKPGDRIGEHEGRLPQLFCVIDGSGWVAGADAIPMRAGPGVAAFWAAGERHAAGTETGMRAVIIQAESLDPDATLTPVAEVGVHPFAGS
ncbi:MAG TPA: hypothetical protein VKB09_13710 [Thermomicrobiales bacterium]|nr:hypothetical protein [Thermomicrobiales bacterium]